MIPSSSHVEPLADTACFHCGEPVPAGTRYAAMIDGAQRAMCCAGCEAVAGAIAGAGLTAYYERRSVPGRQAGAEEAAVDQDLAAYDAPAYQKGLVQVRPDASCEVSLLLEGITCAACIWLVERRLQAMPGVITATVNFSTLRAYVRWDPAQQRLSALIAAIRGIGYDARPFDATRAEIGRKAEERKSLWRLFVAAFGMMQVMMYAVPVYLADGDMTADIERLMHWASLLLTAPVIAFSSVPFFAGAWRDLRARTAGMDVPVALGIVVAFAASVVATFTGRGDVYYDSITMFVFLLLGARYLEAVVRARSGRALDRLVHLLPAFANRLTANGQTVKRVAVAELQRGDCVVVGAGEVLPADGTIEQGESAVDEALISGESNPVPRRVGDAVTGGSTNVSSRLVVRVEKVGADTVVAGIARLIERAGGEKPRIAQLADRIAAHFVWAILALALVAAIGWSMVDPARALPIAIAILVITCPCALSLATPAALTAATGSLMRLGVLVASGHALETLARATHFVFDKTGTLTTGRMTLVGVMPLGDRSRAQCLALAAALESDARHPVARALVEAAGNEGELLRPRVAAAHDFAGDGVEAMLQGRRMRIGRPGFVAMLHGRPLPDELNFVAGHVQVVALGDEEGWIALFTLSDGIRPEARALVRALQADGRTVCLLSGDRAQVAHHVAQELGITVVESGARPEDKVEFVRRLQQGGAIVAMVGDGVNDAPVLAQAQVSVALGSGADLAQIHADIVLAKAGIGHLQDALAVARRCERVIAQNLAWAVLYNVVAVPAAALGQVSPLVASVGMAASSVVVVLNALRAAHPVLWRGDGDTQAVGREAGPRATDMARAT
jgi:Cu2+-exporting ATPase